MWIIFKGFIEFATILFLFHALVIFDYKSCGVLVPKPGIKPAPLALESSLNQWTAREVPPKVLK